MQEPAQQELIESLQSVIRQLGAEVKRLKSEHVQYVEWASPQITHYGEQRLEIKSLKTEVERQSKPNKDADKISGEAPCHIARLCTVRMWESYNEVDIHRRERSRTQVAG